MIPNPILVLTTRPSLSMILAHSAARSRARTSARSARLPLSLIVLDEYILPQLAPGWLEVGGRSRPGSSSLRSASMNSHDSRTPCANRGVRPGRDVTDPRADTRRGWVRPQTAGRGGSPARLPSRIEPIFRFHNFQASARLCAKGGWLG